MCFSATASFTIAAATGTMGVLSLTQISTKRELPLASIPLVFAVQQAIEGCLWLVLPGGGAGWLPAALSAVFVAIGFLVWPLLPSLAAVLIEPKASRRKMIYFTLAIGVGVALYLGIDMVTHPYTARIVGHSLCYVNGGAIPPWLLPFYMTGACGPLVISSHRMLRNLAFFILAGLAISLAFYLYAFISVWCFFAAGTSVIIYLHYAARHEKNAALES